MSGIFTEALEKADKQLKYVETIITNILNKEDKMNTLEGNKLIVEFMGLKPYYNSFTNKYQWSDGIFFSTSMDTEEKAMESIINYVKYATSWDWLMPVVEKIESLGYIVDIVTHKTEISLRSEYPNRSKVMMAPGPKINSTYEAVIRFIKEDNN